MNKLFEDLPLNGSSIYVMQVAKCGCKIYIPVAHPKLEAINKLRLKKYLDDQPDPPWYPDSPLIA